MVTTVTNVPGWGRDIFDDRNVSGGTTGKQKPEALPLGWGSTPVPSDVRRRGNALLVTRDKQGRRVETPVVVTDFSFGLSMLTSNGQLRGKQAIRPIRRQERVLSFTVEQPVYRKNKINKDVERLSKVINDHTVYNLVQDGQVPIKLHLYFIKKVYKGFISQVPEDHSWDEHKTTRRFDMKLMSNAVSHSKVRGEAPYLPTSQDVGAWGKNWYDMNIFIEEGSAAGGRRKAIDDARDTSNARGHKKPEETRVGGPQRT